RVKALQFTKPLVVTSTGAVRPDQNLICRQHKVLIDLIAADHACVAIVTVFDLSSLTDIERQTDDRDILRLPVNCGEEVIRLVFREKPAAADWRQLGWVPEHENWRAKRHQIATKLLIDHRTFVDDDQLCLRDRALAVKRKGRNNGGLDVGLVLRCLIASKAM